MDEVDENFNMHLVDVLLLSEETNNRQKISNKMGLAMHDSTWFAGVQHAEDADCNEYFDSL